jgi:hypothetical protein
MDDKNVIIETKERLQVLSMQVAERDGGPVVDLKPHQIKRFDERIENLMWEAYCMGQQDIINHFRENPPAVSPREAYRTVIKHMFSHLKEEGRFDASPVIDEVVESMENDMQFLTELEDFFVDHLETFGENYGL